MHAFQNILLVMALMETCIHQQILLKVHTFFKKLLVIAIVTHIHQEIFLNMQTFFIIFYGNLNSSNKPLKFAHIFKHLLKYGYGMLYSSTNANIYEHFFKHGSASLHS
jgi:hypothetical protein